MGDRLLGHIDSDLRLAGLSILTSSLQVTKPLTDGSLDCLKKYIPHLFTDSDANFRGEVLSLINILLDRIRGALSLLSKRIERRSTKKGLTIRPQNDSRTDERLFNAHHDFLAWFVSFLTSEMHASASYQRHISAIKLLISIAKSGLDSRVPNKLISKHTRIRETPWCVDIPILKPTLRRLLYDLLLDPFEDVRQGAVNLMQICNQRLRTASKKRTVIEDTFRSQSKSLCGTSAAAEKDLRFVMERARNTMLKTGRVDHADGVARLYALLAGSSIVSDILYSDEVKDLGQETTHLRDVIEEILKMTETAVGLAQVRLSVAIQRHPIHGLFASLRHVVNDAVSNTDSPKDVRFLLDDFFPRIRTVIETLWTTVNGLLCNDAPEGFMPEDMDDDAGFTTKDVMSYAWRAIKESSLFVKDMALIMTQAPNNRDALSEITILKWAGDFSFQQLADLRHRGAFSVVSQTFSSICQQCGASVHPQVRALRQVWYKRTQHLIRTLGSKTTRRSAGIPSLVVGILVSDTADEIFPWCMSDLKSLAATNPSKEGARTIDLPQVHALNSLKAIFTTAKLSERSEPYLVDVVAVAAQCLRSNLWPIRNCGLMLFRSLVDRLVGPVDLKNGSQEASNSMSNLIFARFPTLIDLVIRLLGSGVSDLNEESKTANTSMAAEAVFPVLDLLLKASPPSDRREEILKLTEQAISSSHWHVRELAARTYASCIGTRDADRAVQALMSAPKGDRNTLQGHILCFSFIVRMVLSSAASEFQKTALSERLLLILAENLRVFTSKSASPLVTATYVDTVNTIGIYILSGTLVGGVSKFVRTFNTLCERISRCFELNGISTAYQASLLFEKILVMRFICASVQVVNRSPGTNLDRAESRATVARVDSITETLVPIMLLNVLSSVRAVEQFQAILMPFKIEIWLTLVEAAATCAQESDLGDLRPTIEGFLVQFLDHLVSSPCSGPTLVPRGLREYLLTSDFMLRHQQLVSPSAIENNLRLWGHAISQKAQAYETWDADLIEQTRHWNCLIQRSLQVANDISTRYSAALSMRGLARALSDVPMIPKLSLQEIAFSVYDILIDDDDEIRDLGAEAVSSILQHSRRRKGNVEPRTAPIAARQICTWLVKQYPSSVVLIHESIRRLTGFRPEYLLTSGSVASQLSVALEEDCSLFVKEKQNLYVDEVRETELWSRVLKALSAESIGECAASFSEWVMSGLDVLISNCQENLDGPLGWTAKPDAFVLGIRVICAADVLLEWRTLTTAITVRGSEIRRRLAELRDIGEKNDLHGLWLLRIDSVLERSVAKRLMRIQAVLETFPMQ